MTIKILYNVFTQASSGNPEDILADDDSIITANEIKKNLESLGNSVELFEITNDSLENLNKVNCDVFFNQSYGVGNKSKSESEVTKILEEFDLKFTGSGTDAIDLSNDKVTSKYLFMKNKIPTSKFMIVDDVENIKNFNLKFPVILKLTNEHSSIGIDESNIVSDFESLQKKSKDLFKKYKREILIEEFIDGKEINAAILGNGDSCEVLPLSEITFGKYFETHPKIIDFKAKWVENDPAYIDSVGICPAEIDNKTESLIKEIAKKVHVLSGCRDYSRVDFRLDKDNNPYVLEVNANPGIGPNDGAIRSAKKAGFTYPQFLERIVQLALDRYA